MKKQLRLTPIAALLSAASFSTLIASPALAQSADAAKPDAVNLERIVVTGTAIGGSKMKQSVSISTLEADQITKQAPTSAAEILRSVPGIRSESSGGEGNANLTVRGVPISAGGARYVQFQEDGLPVLLFGDISFGTSDQFLRADYNLDHLEVIRGGSASTLATNSPGGIINFISKNGSEPGGAIGLTLGLDGGRQTRMDFDYAGKLGNKTRFHIGGFNRVGEGDRNTGFNAASGGQIKGNLTQDFDSGYVRVNFKALDDNTPSFMPVPVYVQNATIKQIPGIDPRSAWFIGSTLTRDPVFGKDGSMVTTNPHDGLHVKSTSVGLESEFTLGDGWKVSEKFRKSSNSGRFIALFPANNGDGASPVTSTTFTATLFNTSIDDLGNMVNDLKVSKSFGDAATGKTTLTAGLFSSEQNVALTWFWNQYTIDMKNSGAKATLATTGWNTWGGCCVRSFDVQYTNTAPYAAATWELGNLTLDGSIRRDEQRASGWAIQDDPVTQTWDPATQQNVNYTVSHTSYSLGGNYQLNKDLALFARVSDGVSFSADRLLYGNPLDGSVPVALNEVEQTEAGAKWRSGGFSLFATLFNARTAENNYEATTQKFTANRYSANGAELEMGYKMGDFRLAGGLTLTKAKITASNDASTVGKKPRRQADVVYQLSPSYSFGPFELGAAVIGTGKSFGDDANTITMPGYTVVNAFANWQVNDRASVSLSVNNLGNTVGYTEIEGDGHAARSINGRTAKLGLKYTF
ncbi:MAG: TonB-dependent receptor [Vitreoscilla sp.]|nr:TonB-dependent receptor [Vitreoscilla sp.]